MGIRETLNEKPAIAFGGFGALLLISIVVVFLYMRSGPKPQLEKPVGDAAFYSDDDGKTYFADSLQKVTPFSHGGKDAVRALVYRCKDGHAFVNYLVRHTAAGKQLKGLSLEIGSRPTISDNPVVEVKKPGAGTWIPVSTKEMPKWGPIVTLQCKSDPNEVPDEVLPGQ